MVAGNTINFIIASKFNKPDGSNYYTDISGNTTIISISGNLVDNTEKSEIGFRLITSGNIRIY